MSIDYRQDLWLHALRKVLIADARSVSESPRERKTCGEGSSFLIEADHIVI